MLDIVRDHGLIFLIGDYPHGPLGGLAMTLILSLLGLGLTFPAAVAMALLRTSEVRAFNHMATWFVYGVRIVPLLLVIFWVYYFLPVLTGILITPFMTVLSAIVIYQTAYLSEVIRATIEAVPESALASTLTS